MTCKVRQVKGPAHPRPHPSTTPIPHPKGTRVSNTQPDMAYDPDEPDYLDCELCEPADGSEPYPYAHCCGCGADGSAQYTDCTCA